MATSKGPADSAQSLIEVLSVALGRPVLLDDADLAPIAYSRQWDIDEVRSRSILDRGATKEVREALLAQGIASADDVVHTAADGRLGMEKRACMPVRSGDRVLGYIWLLEAERDLAGDEAARVRQAARELASLLAASIRRRIPDQRELLAGLRDASESRRQEAAAEARSRDLLPDGPLVLCLVDSTEAGGDPLAAVQRAARRLSVGQAIAASAPSRAILVVSLRDPVLSSLAEGEVAAWLQVVAGPGFAVAQSGAASLLSLNEAWRQAELALRVAHSRPGPAVAAWPELGADRLVAQLSAAAGEDVPEALKRLIREEPLLAETLAAFLDAGGDVKKTAAVLFLHRSGVYYRLRRIEELTGLDLAEGDDRLLAHLAIRTERLF